MATTDLNPAAPQPQAPRSFTWRRAGIGIGLVAGGFVLGAVSLASADGGGAPWAGHWHHHHHGMKIGFVQHVVRNQLDSVGATTAQEDKIHDIIATTYTDLDAGKGNKEEMRKQVLDLLRAPTIDRAAAEKLRAEKVAEFDAKSKKVVGAVLDAASQLTPEQRTKIAQRIEDRMAHKHWGWGGHRWGGDHEHDGDRPDGDSAHGPDDHG